VNLLKVAETVEDFLSGVSSVKEVDLLPLKEGELQLNLLGLNLTFEEPDIRRFPCLELAYRAFKMGYPYPIVLNAADEVAVESFLKREIPFTAIPKVIEKTLELADFKEPSSVEEVVEIDRRAKELARKVVKCL
jgi:1-deoxy-D-xylulose-5-phosphate reductoisomerase